jgi:BirA family transcriptional regulator, biotin operon repressor / biotin---[acetyl-CoA-carboxylase] ligase
VPGAFEQPPAPPSDAAGLADLNQAAEELWLACSQQWPTLSIEVLPEVASTNTRALHMGREGADAPCVVVAWRQTAGRGRSGRTWQSAPGHTLTLSLALPMALDAVPGGGSALSLAVGLSVAESIDALQGPGARLTGLKWPNDLWVMDRKLGGILIEASTAPALASTQRWVVIGLGLNLDLGTDAPSDRLSLREMGLPLSPGQAMRALVPGLLQACATFETDGFAPLAGRYAQRDVLAGRQVGLWKRQAPSPTEPQGADTQGLALGVAPDGALQVQALDPSGQPEGKPLLWRMGEVSVRPNPR